MEKRTKMTHDLDENEFKSRKLCVFSERVNIIAAYKTKNASSKFFCKSEQLELNEGRAPIERT